MRLFVFYSMFGIIKSKLVHKVLASLIAINQHIYLWCTILKVWPYSHRLAHTFAIPTLQFSAFLRKFSNCHNNTYLVVPIHKTHTSTLILFCPRKIVKWDMPCIKLIHIKNHAVLFWCKLAGKQLGLIACVF